MTFDRKAALPLGHRFYTSAATLAAWGSGGERGPSFEAYSSRGRKVTWPDVPGDWSTCRLINPPVASHWEKPELPEFWLDGRECLFPESIVTARRWGWVSALGAEVSENARRRAPLYIKPTRTIFAANDGPSPEWLAERDAAGDEIDYGTEGNRIERALVKDKSPLAVTLRQVAELMRTPVIAANDNTPSPEDGEGNPGTGLERVHNQSSILPSVPMLLRAYQAGVDTGDRNVKESWHRIGKAVGKRKLTGLTFMKGELIEYGDDKGRKRRPSYNPKVADAEVDEKSETAKHVAAQPAQNRSYTKMHAAGVYISSQSPDAPRSLAPPPRTARAVANDNILAEARANTKTMPAVTVLPDGVAHEYGRLAGIADLTGVGDGKTSAPMPDALAEMERAAKLETAGLFREDLDVVEDILSDASFRTIGIERGYAESAAHRMGRKVVERALKRISEKIAA